MLLIPFCSLLKEVRVRFVGFGAEEDEWINVRNAVRERSVPLENTECCNLKVGDPVLCFQVIQISHCRVLPNPNLCLRPLHLTNQFH